MSNCKSVTVEGVEFKSLIEASKAYSLDPYTVRARINQLGWSIEEAFGVSKRKLSKTAPKKILLEGVEYPSISEAARQLSKDYNKIILRINRGWSVEEAFGIVKREKKRQCIEITINDVTYNSISAASNALGVDYKLICGRLRQGWPIEDGIWCFKKKTI